MNDTGDLILLENWIVLPFIYQNLAVNLAHAGHLGLTKTKALLRSKVFFPNMEKITTVLGLWTFCKSVIPSHDPHKLIPQHTLSETLDTINLDFLGPFTNGRYIFEMIDQRTKYPDVEFMRSTSARNVIFALEWFFSLYGISDNIVSDNGPTFISYELQGYFTSKGLKHHKTCPLWPQANGQVERFMPSLNKVSQTAFLERKDWKLEIYKFLFSYRNCPHTTTKIPPSDLMFNWKVKFTIPHIDRKINIDNVNNELEKNISAFKQHVKEYHDKRHHAKNISLQIGDRVLLSSKEYWINWHPYSRLHIT